ASVPIHWTILAGSVKYAKTISGAAAIRISCSMRPSASFGLAGVSSTSLLLLGDLLQALEPAGQQLSEEPLQVLEALRSHAEHALKAMSLRRCSGPRSMTDRAPMLEPFDALIGTWYTEATHPLVDGVVPGSITFEWLEGGRFLIQRSRNDHELFPDAICVIGPPEAGGGLLMEYFDSRGVRRTYGISLDAGVLRMWREHPGFDQ